MNKVITDVQFGCTGHLVQTSAQDGKKDEFRTKQRKIVANFLFFRDRKLVCFQAPKKLKGSNIWVNEQFPPEIEEKRKTLYPVMRTARKNGHRVKLVRDSLYIDGRPYVPPALTQDDSDQAEYTGHKTDYASVTKAGGHKYDPKSIPKAKIQ